MPSLFDSYLERRHTQSIRWGDSTTDIIPMTVADMDFAVPPAMLTGLKARMAHPVLGYTDAGLLKEKIQAYLQQEYQWSVPTNAILILPSVANGLYLLAQYLISPYEHSLLPSPYYHKFEEALLAHSRAYSTVPLTLKNNRWVIDLAKLEQVLQPQTRWLLLCNPHNPTGTVLDLQECIELSQFCRTHGLMVCSDEIHAPIVLDPQKTHQPIAHCMPEMATCCVTLMSLNKVFNYSGTGLAFGVCENPEWQVHLSRAIQYQSIRPSLFAYVCTELALEHGASWRAELLSYLWQSQKIIRDFLIDYPQIHWAESPATYLAWLDFSEASTNPALNEWQAAGVLPLKGSDFGFTWDRFVRLNYAMPHRQLEIALARIRTLLA